MIILLLLMVFTEQEQLIKFFRSLILFHPIIFLGKQIGILIPFFLMFLFLISKFKIKFNFKDKKLLFLINYKYCSNHFNVFNFFINGNKN